MKAKRIVCAIATFLLAAAFTLAFCSCNKGGGKPKIALVAGDGGTLPTFEVEVKEGDSVLAALSGITPVAEEGLEFAGWFEGDSPVSEDRTMSKENITLKAKFFAQYTLKSYIKGADGSYPESPKETYGRAIYHEPFEATFGEHFSLDETKENRVSTTKLEKDEVFSAYLNADLVTVRYVARAPQGVQVQAPDMIRAAYGTDVELSSPTILSSERPVKFAGWSTSNGGDVEYAPGDAVEIAGSMDLYACWFLGYSDLFSGSDVIYVENGKAVLEREGFERLEGELNEESGYFKFEREGDFIDGRIAGDKFYYFEDTLEKTYKNYDGSSDTLTLLKSGKASFSSDGESVDGEFEYVEESDSYILSLSNGKSIEFVFATLDDEVRFRTANSQEKGFYALKVDAQTVDFDVIELDGMGRLNYISENGSTLRGVYQNLGDSVFSMRLDLGGAPIAENILLEKKPGTLGKYTLSGVYTLSDDYFGTYQIAPYISEELIKRFPSMVLTLDGFGRGSVKIDSYDPVEGTYTVEHCDSWHMYSASGYYEVTEYYVQFVAGDETYKFAFSQDLGGRARATLIKGARGKFDFSNALFNDSTGAYYNVEGQSKAFLFIHDTIGESEDRYADVYVGSFDAAEAQWIYVKYDEGSVTYTGENYLFEGIGIEEEFHFAFTIDEDSAQVTFLGEDLVIFENETGKLYIDEFGVSKFTMASGETSSVDFKFEDGLVYIYTFALPSGSRSFYIESDGGVRRAVEIKAEDILDIDYLFEDRRNAYKARVIKIGESEAVLGVLTETGAYFYCYFGTLTPVEGTEDEFKFVETNSAFAENEMQDVMAVYGNFRFKVVEEGGAYKFFQYDVSYNLSGRDGTLTTDGYGMAEYTTQNGKISGHYVLKGNLITLSESASKTEYTFRLLSESEFEVLSEIGEEMGYYYTLDEGGDISAYYFFLDGAGTVLLFEGNAQVWGTYARTSNKNYEEYSLTFEFETYTAIVARDEEVNVYYLRDELMLGDFEVEGGGRLTSDGYFFAYYSASDSESIEGVMQRGNLIDDDYSSARNFEGSADGEQILFRATSNGSYTGEEYVFDIIEGKAKLRRYHYGEYIIADGDSLIYLDGHGFAKLYGADGELIDDGAYSPVREISDTSYSYISSVEGGRAFIFSLAREDGEYKYFAYDETSDGVFFVDAFSALILDGYETGTYVSRYGVKMTGKYDFVYDSLVLLKLEGGGSKYFDVSGSKATPLEGDFIVTGDTLYLYLGVLSSQNRSLKIPNGVKKIESNAFKGTDLDYLEQLDLNEVESVSDNMFEGLSLKKLVGGNLKVIGASAFKNNQSLTDVSVPLVVTIGESAFEGCSSLSKIDLPACEDIGARAFAGCSGLNEVVFGGLKSIGERAFSFFTGDKVAFDFCDATDILALQVASNAFDDGYDGTLNMVVLVKDIATFNEVFSSSLISAFKDNARIKSLASDSFDDNDFFSFASGKLLNFYDGKVTLVQNVDGEVVETALGLYYVDRSGAARLYALDGSWTERGSFASGATLSYEGDVFFKDGVEHSFKCADNKTLVLVIDANYSSSYSYMSLSVDKIVYDSKEGSNRSYENGVIKFTLDDGTYTATFDGESWNVTKTGALALVEAELNDYIYRFTFMLDEDGNATEIFSMSRKNVYGGGDFMVDDYKATKDGLNKFVVEVTDVTLATRTTDKFELTYVSQESVTMDYICTTVLDGDDSENNYTVSYSYTIENGAYKLLECTQFNGYYAMYQLISSTPQEDGSLLVKASLNAAEHTFRLALEEYGLSVALVVSQVS